MKPKILQAIREANPELMELSFGCEVKAWIDDDEFVLRHINDDGIIIVECEEYDIETIKELLGTEENIFEIIGHPPELRHLLRAIAKEPSDYEMWLDATRFDTPHLLATKYGEREDFEKPMFSYDLTKPLPDNLDNEELCTFLFDLLVKE